MQQIKFTSLGIRAFVGALAITVCLTLPGAIAADQANSPLLTGLAAQYTFSGNANDDSGNGHHGEVMGATLTADRFGNQNAAYHFDGVDDYLRIRHPITSALPYSWSLWVRPESDHFSGQHWYFMQQGGERNTGDESPTIQIDAGRVLHYSEYHPRDGGIHTLYAMPSFVSSRWYHIVTTADLTGRHSIYLNGVLASSSQFDPCLVENGCPYCVSSNMYIGANIAGSCCYFPGDIDDIGIYRRVLSSDEVAALYAFTGDPNQPPLIWAQPASQSVLSGDVLTLRAMALGEQPCSYQWQLGGVDLQDDARTSGATSSTLQISAVTPADAGAYTVVVSNAHGSVTSKPAILTVLLRPPEITAEPENQTLVSGVPAIFRVSAVGSLPMAYQWHRNGVELTDDGRLTGTRSETLNISAVGVTDIGVYTVVISNAYGSVTGRPATLSVLLQPPQLLTEAEDQTVMSGSPVTFSVTATGSLPLDYQWQRNGVDVVDDGRIVGAKAPTLTIADVRPDDLGLYTVVVRNAYGWIVSFPAELNVILAPPAITTQPNAVTMALGSTVSVTVEAIGSLPLSYQWQRDGVDVTDGARIAGAQTGTLTITDFQISDIGNYVAIISNPMGRVLSRTVMVETFSVVLHIRREGPNAVLWWNETAEGMKLQTTLHLKTPEWQEVPGTESVTAFTVPIESAGGAYFRLFQKGPMLDMTKFAWIPPGTFLMGSPETERGRYWDEGPQTQVTITSGFWMSRNEVTQAQFLAVMGHNPSQFQGDLTRPVDQATWYEANEYCTKLTKSESAAARLSDKFTYRLPTEAEWEYACRAGTMTRFSFGDSLDCPDTCNACISRSDYMWWCGNSDGFTHPVASKQPNPWGLYDMHGNLWEWCSDWWTGALPGGSVTNPVGPDEGSHRVLRGGMWSNQASECRSASRQHHGVTPDMRRNIIGFRVVLAPVQR